MKFPVYKFNFSWLEPENGSKTERKFRKDHPEIYEGIPLGKTKNSTGFTKMFREKPSDADLQKVVDDYIDYLKTSRKEPTDFISSVKFFGEKSWHCTWFQHETFDVGQSDAEALASFEEYVRETEQENQALEAAGSYGISLMGAEDRWRWHGSEPNGEPSDHSPAPCRCKFCKEQGIIRIAH
jgi:hypothetical protein